MANRDTTSSQERRTSHRHNIHIDVNYSAGAAYLFCRSENLSELGIFLATEETFDVQTQIELRFRVSEGGEPLEIKGEVVWVEVSKSGKKKGMGVRFLNLTDPQKERIKSLIRTIAYLDD